MKKVTWFVFLSIIAISCLNEPDCYQLDNDAIGVAFSVMEFGEDFDSLKYLYISGANGIFYLDTTLSAVLLPLNPNTDEIECIFYWKDENIDTLLLGYKSQIQYVSEDCGQRYVFDDLTPVRSTFDSVRVVSASPGYPASTNLVIYRCANPDVGGVKFRTKKGTVDADSVLNVTDVELVNFDTETLTRQVGPSFYLPLNKRSDTTIYEFKMNNGEVENLSLSYTRLTRKSPIQDCDSVTFFSKIKIIATTFDTTSTKLINTAPAGSVTRSTNTKDPAIINFEIFL